MSARPPEPRSPIAAPPAVLRAAGLPAPRLGVPPPLAAAEIDAVVRPALQEDRGGGDQTSAHAVPESARATATLLSKSAVVVAGLAVFARAFELCDPTARVAILGHDGARIARGDVLVRVEGSARALLTAERTAYFSSSRQPGVVLRVSRMRVFKPATAST